jgi:hypothetical protein
MMMIHRTMALRRSISVSGHPLEPTAFVAALAVSGAQFFALPGAFAIHSTVEAVINDEGVTNADMDAIETMPRLCEYLRAERLHDANNNAGMPIDANECTNVTFWRGSLSHNWDLQMA